MSKNQQSLQQTIQLIVDILSFDSSDDSLKNRLSTSTIDWDKIVIVSSEHLVLPAVYCRLHQKSLITFLPEDLVSYLEELTELNRERNRTLLTEVEQISKLFQSHDINHVFIKGIALLAGKYFKDIGERMIGDIDILVASEDLDQAFDLLVQESYSKLLAFNYEVKNYRHRPRQISKKRLGAIELHDQLLKHGYNHLIDKESVLKNKKTIGQISTPNAEHLIWNTILGHQVNDRSYYYNVLKLKGIYDVLAVGLSQRKSLIDTLSNQKYSLHFLNLASVFYSDIAPTKPNTFSTLKRRSFLLTLKFRIYQKCLNKLKAVYILIFERLKLLFFNKSYRHHIFKNKLKS